MQTAQYTISLPEEEKKRLVKEAKGGSWYDGWTPYCIPRDEKGNYLPCTSPRMTPMPYGFRCPCCGDMIGFNLERLVESPLNKRQPTEGWGAFLAK